MLRILRPLGTDGLSMAYRRPSPRCSPRVPRMRSARRHTRNHSRGRLPALVGPRRIETDENTPQNRGLNSEPSLSSTMKRSTRAQDIDRDRSANAASASATADPASAIMMSPTVLQHNLADHAKAAALQAAADAAAAAATDPKILRAVLLAAAATANALASTIPLDAVPTHRRGGRPPKTRRANPRPRPRRMHTGAPAPTADSTSTARQSSQHSAFADCPPRAGQARPQPGARPPRFDSTRSTTLATRQILPKVEPTVMRLNGRD